MRFLHWLVFLGAALLEIGGDALIRRGLKSSALGSVMIGVLALGAYGLTVNLVKWDFARLLGVYVAVFALVSVLFSRFVLSEAIPTSTWVGISVIVAGGLIIQWGSRA